ncbi:MAG: HNH endonuclease signature motif containing protein [Patescibacteria group bacterium]|nr:HNH endonuclease [Patescibacteria group bacterium]
MNVKKLSDGELYGLCKQYGFKAREWTRKFAGLLPEVYHRRLYKRRGYSSIYEFAAKLASMRKEQVDRILRLSGKLEDKPTLKKQFETGAQSWSKVEKVAYIATSDNEKEWAEKVETMPQQALVLCVQNNRSESTACGNPQPEWNTLSFKVSPQVEAKLRRLKQKLEKERGEALTWNEAMEAMMEGAPQEERVEIKVCPDCIKRRETARKNPPRTIRKDVQRLVLARQEYKCAFPECTHPPEIFHHAKRFSKHHTHDPDCIRALCKRHERLAHCGMIKGENSPPEDWRLRDRPEPGLADQLMMRNLVGPEPVNPLPKSL